MENISAIIAVLKDGVFLSGILFAAGILWVKIKHYANEVEKSNKQNLESTLVNGKKMDDIRNSVNNLTSEAAAILRDITLIKDAIRAHNTELVTNTAQHNQLVSALGDHVKDNSENERRIGLAIENIKAQLQVLHVSIEVMRNSLASAMTSNFKVTP